MFLKCALRRPADLPLPLGRKLALEQPGAIG
jgi:hypothetical protein